MGGVMRDLDSALSDIADIRSRLAAGTMFMGLGPHVIAATGLLAIGVGVSQATFPAVLAADPVRFLLVWVAAALVSGAAVAVEMVARSRRHHGGMATTRILQAIELFAPAAAAGACVALVLMRFAPEALWLTPGLWQIFMAVGVFAAVRVLPWGISLVAAWYFVSGVVTLLAASESQALSPWMMAAPFAVGQLGMAFVLRLANGRDDA